MISVILLSAFILTILYVLAIVIIFLSSRPNYKKLLIRLFPIWGFVIAFFSIFISIYSDVIDQNHNNFLAPKRNYSDINANQG